MFGIPLSFGTPLILAALLGLPVLWWLLRVTPPLPRRTLFPPLRLLRGLEDEEQAPAATPWWLLLLRLLAAALLILALADPLLGRSPKLTATGPLVLVVDNGWTTAKGWDARQELIADLLHSAAGRPIAIIPTAGTAPTGLLNEGEAARIAKELKPMPWPGDRAAAAAALGRFNFAAAPALYWLSDGIEDGKSQVLRDAFKRYGGASVFGPSRLPLGLLPVTRDASGFSISAIRARAGAPLEVEAGAIGARGETLAATRLHFKRGDLTARGHISLPMEVRNATTSLSIAGEDSAGSVQLLDRGAAQRSAGIVSESASGEGQPLLSDVYYLERALSPYAEIAKGGVAQLIDKHVSVLLLADVAKISAADIPKVKDFVSHGGVLIRFAGERMTGGSDELVPVRLRAGGRYLGSAMAWSAPQHLAGFGPLSPFNGLEIASEVTVSRQILAEPSAELSNRTWAQLSDGTPLITAQAMGSGWIVLFHTAASPGWSSLPLSGLYVEMLKR
ncbi:MAG: BatA domain-containing protein, partial [Alphaproteobacteria bacterium]|nr:BatA domain-containing protein [Alphaproteobacteria bacterium]